MPRSRRRLHPPAHCVIVQREQSPCELVEGRDLDWHEAMAPPSPPTPVPVAATDPLYVLYTSGTTGKPKGVVRDNGGHAVALMWSMRHIYDMAPGEVFWAASDVGWVVGHSYIVYAPLLLGATTVLYEGKPVGTPDPGAFWRVIAEHQVKVLFTAPTAIRAIRKEDPDGAHLARYDLSALKYLFLAGERLDPDTYHWAVREARHPGGRPLVADRDRLGDRRQSRSVWSRCRSRPGRRPCRCPATTCRSCTPTGCRADPARRVRCASALRCRRAHCPRCGATMRATRRPTSASIPGYYLTGDGGYLDEDGYLFVMGRIDDVINVAGHRLSTGAIEAVLAAHPAVAECAVIGVADEIKGQVPRGLVVLKAGASADGLAARTGRVGAQRDRRGRQFQAGRRRAGAAQDTVGQDPAQDDARHRRTARTSRVPSTIEDPRGTARAAADPGTLAGPA